VQNKDGVYIDLYQGKSTVFRAGNPIEIRGVSGFNRISEAREAGANVIRTWDEKNAKAILDSALANHMYVMMGIYIPKPREGADFKDQKFIEAQFERIAEIVNAYKNHPALLIWGVGNEVELYPTDLTIWRRLNDFIKHVKSLDNRHLVTTMITPFRKTIFYSKIFLDDLDILSINCFGQIVQLEEKLGAPLLGWDRPIIISEWGTNGPWEELEKTKWGVPIEKNSSKKAEIISDRFEKYLGPTSQLNIIGSFIFYWGHIEQYTNTWFSIFSEGGERSEIFYTMKNIWKDNSDAILPPHVSGIHINGKSAYDNIFIKRNDLMNAQVSIESSLDSLNYFWRVSKDNIIIEESDRLVSNLKDENLDFICDENMVQFNADMVGGPYRLFVEIYDQHNNFAYANIPFYVLE
jgi:hypothetical protein